MAQDDRAHGRQHEGEGQKGINDVLSHAALNASLNGTSAILLACGYAAIRRRNKKVHKVFMISACAVTAAFFVSYLTYHYRVGHVPFEGQGWIRPVYFTILISHTILAAVIVPMVVITLRRAWIERFDRHRIIARWTLPLWFYVSITGVIVYVLLYQMYPHGIGTRQRLTATSVQTVR